MYEDDFRQGLQTNTFAQHLYAYKVTDSTNTRAKELVKQQPVPEGTVFIAATQTAGRGTGGHHWESTTPESLLFSLVLQAPLRQQPLSFLPAIALVRTLRQYAGIAAHLKWPNDVLVGDRKLAGILCESAWQPEQQLAWIIGVGINVNQLMFPNSIRHLAISMQQIAGKPFSIEHLFQHYMLEMEQLYYSEEDLIQAWLADTQMVGKTIRTTQHGVQQLVKVCGLSPEGYLRVEHPDGQVETWMSTSHLDIDQAYSPRR